MLPTLPAAPGESLPLTARVVAVAWLARMTLSRFAAVAAVVLFGCAPLAIQYSWQVRPYSADKAAAVLLAVAVWVLRQPRWSYRHGMAWWLVAAVAAAFSFLSMFVSAASAAVLVLDRLLRGAARAVMDGSLRRVGSGRVRARCAECVRFCVPVVAWLAVVALDYVEQLRYLKGSQNRHPSWIGAFGPEDGSLGGRVSWSWSILNLFMTSMFAATVTSVAVLLVVLGAVALWWRERGQH